MGFVPPVEPGFHQRSHRCRDNLVDPVDSPVDPLPGITPFSDSSDSNRKLKLLSLKMRKFNFVPMERAKNVQLVKLKDLPLSTPFDL